MPVPLQAQHVQEIRDSWNSSFQPQPQTAPKRIEGGKVPILSFHLSTVPSRRPKFPPSELADHTKPFPIDSKRSWTKWNPCFPSMNRFESLGHPVLPSIHNARPTNCHY